MLRYALPKEYADVMSYQIISPRCFDCGKKTNVEVTEAEFDRYQAFKQGLPGPRHIQDVFPDWSADQREMLLSGTHPECWDRMFGDEDEENDE